MKKVRVKFEYVFSDGTIRDEEMFVGLSQARSKVEQNVIRDGSNVVISAENIRTGPWVSQSSPFVGELEEHEIDFLRKLPGHGMHQHYKFTVEGVK